MAVSCGPLRSPGITSGLLLIRVGCRPTAFIQRALKPLRVRTARSMLCGGGHSVRSAYKGGQHEPTSEVSINPEVAMPASRPTVRPPSLVPATFACTLRDGGLNAAWVRVTGELDLATAPQLEQTLQQADLRAPRIVLDLRQLTFMDSSGVHVIVEASRRARQAGHRLVLVRGPLPVDRVLKLTRASDVLEIVDLEPAEPPVQALLRLARQDRAA